MLINDDLNYVDGLETVTVTPAGGGAPVAVAHALRRRAHHSEAAPSGGVYTEHDIKWFLSTVDLPARPEPGARITDAADEIWTVLDVSADALAAAWRCRARNLALAENLADRVDILRAAWLASAAGAASAVWIKEHADVPARIQPVEAAIEIANHQRTARATHRIYLSQQIAIDANHRITHGADAYRVFAYEMHERIDKLPVILAEKEP